MSDASSKPGLTRRAFSALGAVPLLASPATIASAAARPEAGVRFVAAGDAQADPLSVLYNLSHAETPALRALCSTSQGVAQTIRWARENDKSFAIRSGGHCYAGTGSHPDLVIDLREMDDVRVDSDAQLIKAQSGAKLGAVHRAGFTHNLGIPAGWCADVGLGGHALGGGIGYLVRDRGLMCDQVTQVQLIDAEGRLRTCTADDDADLFWASRGGGGGMGVVTDFTFTAASAPPTQLIRVFGAMAADGAAGFWARWNNWSWNAPRDTSSQLNVNVMSDGRIFVRISGLSQIPAAELMTQLQDVGGDDLPIDERSVVTGNYADLMEEHILSIPAFYLHQASRSSFLPPTPNLAVLESVLETLTESVSPNGSVSLLIECLGGALDDVSTQDTAYPHRGAGFLVTASTAGVSEDTVIGQQPALQAVDDALQTEAVGRGYANYRDRLLGDNFANAYWGENLRRLQTIKQAVDPDGVFSGEHTVPLPV